MMSGRVVERVIFQISAGFPPPSPARLQPHAGQERDGADDETLGK